ncbi:MAG: TrmB family transcriptional regulator [Nitrososphaerales archaeon]
MTQLNPKRSIEEIEASLKENFKLSGYETKTYLSLLKLGKQNPKQLSASAGVPMPRVYDTLDSLMSKGFVVKQDEHFSPIPARQAIHGRSVQFEVEFSKEQSDRRIAEEQIVTVLENFTQTSVKAKQAGEISILKGFNSIANKFSELLESAQEVILVAKRAVEAREVFIPILLEFAEGDQKPRKRLCIIVPKEAKISKTEIASAKRASAEIRKSDNILFDMMITDLNDVIIGVPDPLSDELNHAVAIWVRNPSFARSTRASIEEIWKSSERL